MRYLIFAILSLSLAGCVSAPQNLARGKAPIEFYEGDREEFLDFFHQAAFSNQMKAEIPYLRKRVVYFRAKIIDGATRDKRKLLEKHLGKVTEFLPFGFKFVAPEIKDKPGDIQFRFAPYDTIAEMMGNQKYACFTENYERQGGWDGSLIATKIWLPSDRPQYLENCIQGTLHIALGLEGQVEGYDSKTNILRATSGFTTDPSPWDRLALWILYDTRLQPGMKWHEAKPILEEIMDELGR